MKRRADDNPETVAQRLQAYHAQTAPLISYYEDLELLVRVEAMGDISESAGALDAIVEQTL